MSALVEIDSDALKTALGVIDPDKIIDIASDSEINSALGTSYVNFEHPYIIDLSWAGKGYWFICRGHNAYGTIDIWAIPIDKKTLELDYTGAKKLYSAIAFTGANPVPIVIPYDNAIYMVYCPAAGSYRIDKFDTDFNLVSTGTSTSLPNASDIVMAANIYNKNARFMMTTIQYNPYYIRMHLMDETWTITKTAETQRIPTAWLLEHSYIYPVGMFIAGVHEVAYSTANGKLNKYVPWISWTHASLSFMSICVEVPLPLKYFMPADWLHSGIQFTDRPWLVFVEALNWPWSRGNFRFRAIPVSWTIFDYTKYKTLFVYADNGQSSFSSREYWIMLPRHIKLMEVTIIGSTVNSYNVTITGGSEGETIGAETLGSASAVTGNQYLKIIDPPRLVKIKIDYGTATDTAHVRVWLRA